VFGVWQHWAEGEPFFGMGSWERTHEDIRRRGDLWKISREEVWTASERTAGSFGGTREVSEQEGPHTSVGVFEEDAKDRRVVLTNFTFEGSTVSGRPRRLGVTAPRPRRLVGKAKQPISGTIGASEASASAMANQARAPEAPANFMEGRLTPLGEPRIAGA